MNARPEPRWRLWATAGAIVIAVSLDWPTLIIAAAPYLLPALAAVLVVGLVVAWGCLFYLDR